MNMIPPVPDTAAPERLLLHGVDWATYEKFLDAVGKRPLRMTYDGRTSRSWHPPTITRR